MNYRNLGSTGIKVSEIGFGTWGIGGVNNNAIGYGPSTDEKSIEALNYAFDCGITFYDTAPLYGFGHSEKLLGTVFSDKRERIILASKVGMTDFEGNINLSTNYIKSTIEGSLNRLKTDYLDILLLHSPPVDLLNKSDEIYQTLTELKKNNLVKVVGLSGSSPEDCLNLINEFDFEVIEVNFNLADQRTLDINLFEVCGEKNVGIIARTPLSFGLLTGKYNNARFHQNDHRKNWSRKQIKCWVDAITLFKDNLKEKVESTNSQLALRFCLSYPITTTIPGMMNIKEVQENVKSSDQGPLSFQNIKTIEDVYKKHSFIV